MHEQFLLAALDQAWHGRGMCAPNPSVGAVAVQNGVIIAKAWHHGVGTLHAEQLLLSKLAPHLSGITLYVTLEPCNHWGRTPPCVDAIVSYGVEKVVYAYRDPNPVVIANNTPALLKEQGIEVVHHPLAEIDAFYKSYRHWMLTRKPWVTVKVAQSFDGKIAGKEGERVQLSNALCAEFTHKKRLHSDIILTTAQTVNRDNPWLNVRLADKEIAKPVAIIDRRCILKPDMNVLNTAKERHIFYDEQQTVLQKHPQCSYYPVTAKEERLDIEAVLNHLGALGYHDVWVEAGSNLFRALHEARLVNQTYIYLVPKVLGKSSLSLYEDIDLFKNPCTITWKPMGNNMIASFEWQYNE